MWTLKRDASGCSHLPITAASRHFLRSGGQMLYLELAKSGRLAAKRYRQA
jgi:hypothetical protein